MAQAIGNPQEIRKFAANLKGFTEQRESNTSRLRMQFKQLGETWRDQEHAKFAREFEQTEKILDCCDLPFLTLV